MKQRMNWRVWATVVALALGSSIWAGVPASMAVQAIFQDSSGSLLSGSHVIKVGIYDGDVLKWQETFTKIFSKGVFSEVVGIQNPITAENINLTSAKFGFVIDDEPVQLVRLTAVPYALHARFAKTAENIPAATSTFLGGIKVGRGLDMDSNGVLSVSSSNYNAGLSINGTMTATSFEGDGSRLTGIPRYTTGPGLNSNGSLLSIGSNVVTSNYNGTVWINGTVSATSFEGDGSRLTNLNTGGSAPITVTTTPYQMDDNRRFLIVNNSAGPTTILLPNNPLSSGRVIKIKTIQAQSVISMTPIVVPLNSETPGTAILSGVAGKWAELVSDGTNWVIMSGN